MMIGYDIYDRFTVEHFPVPQKVTDDQNLLLATVHTYRLSQNSRPRENRQMPTTISILKMQTKNNKWFA
jgi:hypothetical protein